jgi:hypothetical protein
MVRLVVLDEIASAHAWLCGDVRDQFEPDDSICERLRLMHASKTRDTFSRKC